MGPNHLLAATRYVLLNPVRAGLVASARQWRWSSMRAHLSGKGDGVVEVGALSGWIEDWRALMAGPLPDEEATQLRKHARTGRPLGDQTFIKHLEAKTGRDLQLKPLGRPRSSNK